jgi:ATP-dependent helicase HepA
MHDFIPGQRWISDTELAMGLGTVMATEHRTVTILFLATGETRVYAKQTAPLTRVLFAAGDRIRSHEGWVLTVEDVSEQVGILSYHGQREDGTRTTLEEGQLDNFIQLSRPTERLFTGQIDPDKWFELRYQTRRHLNRLAHSDLYGLTGSRTSLIPHQLYIAHEVANRYAPRVMLADEVGLGKTIEAGLILHHQLLTERAQRVLIVVPETLLHQWLVEMLRRFNRHFSIFDEERCQAAEESNAHANPFDTEQLVLCSLGFLREHPQRLAQALAGEWDLLVVDEAHHLQWSPEAASPEYTLVEKLAAQTKGVLLLTATPEQLGKSSHFARLRLLDPDRFSDFGAFVAEEQAYQPLAATVAALLQEQPLPEDAQQALRDTLAEQDNRHWLAVLQDAAAGDDQQREARKNLMDNLLDRHGTGRVLFRNTRAAVEGFPQRQVAAYPLPLADTYAAALKRARDRGNEEPARLLCPERLYQAASDPGQRHWTQVDARIPWLSDRLAALKPRKVLVITASARSALDIAQSLKAHTGLHAAVFHKGMSIVERDRAAAYFADEEKGSQVLICSEIGSEGRNFQFAHHLILFDLPLNPDLLEQRIGRLDRIGQRETIHIHVPYLQHTAQAVMYQWYQHGLGAFEHTCPAGHSVFTRVEQELTAVLQQAPGDEEQLQALVATTRHWHEELNAALHRGRDRLLEYNSCQPAVAGELLARARAQDDDHSLEDYLDAAFDCLGVDVEVHKTGSYIVRPGTQMQAHLPGLAEDGATVCYARATALAHEDMQFLTWEHPWTDAVMDLVTSSEMGNTALIGIKHPGVKPGTLLLESLYILDTASSEALPSRRFLPPTTIRVVMDEAGGNHQARLSHDAINQARISLELAVAQQVVRARSPQLRAMAAASEQLATEQAPAIIAQAHGQIRQTLEREISRLQALRQVNPNVREEEIRFFETQWQALNAVIDAANIRLDALRVIVAT